LADPEHDPTMQEHEFSEVIELIRKENPRFGKGAYVFVRQALDHTLRRREEKKVKAVSRHVSGQELLEGIREFALDQYGPLAGTLLAEWNVAECRHFGEIVFQLVDYGVLGKTDDDKLEDFCDGYDFDQAFAEPFRPTKKDAKGRQSAKSRE
jgi:uncharacterized repeat protein (TIGR04138 family)